MRERVEEEYESRGGNFMVKIKKGPPRPPTAYFMFLEAFRQDYKIRNPEVKGIKEMAREAIDKWRSMDQVDKEPYEMKAKAAKAEYNRLKAMTPEERVQATEHCNGKVYARFIKPTPHGVMFDPTAPSTSGPAAETSKDDAKDDKKKKRAVYDSTWLTPDIVISSDEDSEEKGEFLFHVFIALARSLARSFAKTFFVLLLFFPAAPPVIDLLSNKSSDEDTSEEVVDDYEQVFYGTLKGVEIVGVQYYTGEVHPGGKFYSLSPLPPPLFLFLLSFCGLTLLFRFSVHFFLLVLCLCLSLLLRIHQTRERA